MHKKLESHLEELESQDSSNCDEFEPRSPPDNVQTLIDAVQELIQSHDEGKLVTTKTEDPS